MHFILLIKQSQLLIMQNIIPPKANNSNNIHTNNLNTSINSNKLNRSKLFNFSVDLYGYMSFNNSGYKEIFNVSNFIIAFDNNNPILLITKESAHINKEIIYSLRLLSRIASYDSIYIGFYCNYFSI